MSGEGETAGVELPNFSGKYALDKSENFEEFLAANGANWLIRKMAANSSPDLEVTQEGNKVTFRLHSMVMDKTTSFTVGEDFDETQQDGNEFRITPAWEGKKLILKLNPKKEGAGKPQVHTRELEGDNTLILTLQVADVTAKRYFKRVPAA